MGSHVFFTVTDVSPIIIDEENGIVYSPALKRSDYMAQRLKDMKEKRENLSPTGMCSWKNLVTVQLFRNNTIHLVSLSFSFANGQILLPLWIEAFSWEHTNCLQINV